KVMESSSDSSKREWSMPIRYAYDMALSLQMRRCRWNKARGIPSLGFGQLRELCCSGPRAEYRYNLHKAPYYSLGGASFLSPQQDFYPSFDGWSVGTLG
ncbi:MAG: hypothetical protein ACE5KV_07370, partial [Thermoplasmata archaeon]